MCTHTLGRGGGKAYIHMRREKVCICAHGGVCVHWTHLVHILIKGSVTFLIIEGSAFRFLH